MPQTFLDRLLRAGKSTNKTPEEARDMVELAVSVIGAFTTLMTPDEYGAALLERTTGLVNALEGSAAVTKASILKTLLAFMGVARGAHVLLRGETEVLMRLVDAAAEMEMAMQVLLHAFVNADRDVAGEALARFLPELCGRIMGMDGQLQARVLKFLAELLARVPPEQLPDDTAWVSTLYDALLRLLGARHTSAIRHSGIVIAAALLHRYPPALLFSPANVTAPADPDAKPPLHHFLQLTLITLRASFPSLLESLNTPTYAATSQTLAAAYDITAALLTHLITASDDDDDHDDSSSTALPPTTLLQLRTDLSETFSLTLEHLRDRWDAAFAGASGLELDLTPGHGEPGVPLTLTWDHGAPGGLLRDPIIMASVRALALWLREDESLRVEAGGLMDVWLGLWARGADAGVDYRVWVVAALEGVLEEEHGRAEFARCGGWRVVFSDLKRIYNSPGGGGGAGEEEDEDELRVGVAEARLLAEGVALAGEAAEGMVVDAVALAGIKGTRGLRLELDAEVLRLASACVVNVHRGVRKRLAGEVAKVKEVARRLVLDLYERGAAEEESEVMALVAEVAEEMEGL
ncbi:Neurochondrin-domain-containing protein [Morchella snyderi]|nr:Neurochondrin-domain-containing protein [Morchella snyderi]